MSSSTSNEGPTAGDFGAPETQTGTSKIPSRSLMTNKSPLHVSTVMDAEDNNITPTLTNDSTPNDDNMTPVPDTPDHIGFKKRALEMLSDGTANIQNAIEQLTLRNASILRKPRNVPDEESDVDEPAILDDVDKKVLLSAKALVSYALSISTLPLVSFIVRRSLPEPPHSILGLLCKSHAVICFSSFTYQVTQFPHACTPNLLETRINRINNVSLYASIASVVITGLTLFADFPRARKELFNMSYLISSIALFPAAYGLSCIYNAYRKVCVQRRILSTELRKQKARHADELELLAQRKSLFLRTVSHEFRDVAHSALQNLQQIAPPRLMAKAVGQQFSASSIALPTTCISTLHQSLKSIHHLSTHLGNISSLLERDFDESMVSRVRKAFNVEDVLQNVADILSGVAAAMNVEIVLFEDKPLATEALVLGDKGGLRHALISLLKTVLDVASPGAVIEVGLFLECISLPSMTTTTSTDEEPLSSGLKQHVRCCIEITHNPSTTASASYSTVSPDANLTMKLLLYLGAHVLAEESENSKQRIRIMTTFERATRFDEIASSSAETPDLAPEQDPSTVNLQEFAKTLQGFKSRLIARESSFHAKHVEKCLQACNVQVKRLNLPSLADLKVETTSWEPVDFVIIDDDLDALMSHLKPFLSVTSDRTRVTPMQNTSTKLPFVTVIYYTSLGRYSAARDTLHTLLQAEWVSKQLLDVLILLKPATTRRLFASLQNALQQSRPDLATSTSQSQQAPIQQQVQEQQPLSSGSSYFPLYQTLRRDSGLDASSFRPTHEATEFLKETIAQQQAMIDVGSIGTVITQNGQTGIYFRPNPKHSSSLSRGRAGTPPPQSSGGAATSMGRRMSLDGTTLVRKGGLPSTPTIPANSVRQGQESGAVTTVLSPGSSGAGGNTSTSGPPPPGVSSTSNTSGLTPGSSDALSAENSTSSSINRKGTSNSNSNSIRKPSKKTQAGSTGNSGLANLSPSFGFMDGVVPRIKVLIVEDNPINQTILSTFMRKRRIRFSVASNGQEAVDTWSEGGFHLVLMDIQLPVMDGIQATKEIRRMEKMNNVGVYPVTPPISSENFPNPLSSSAAIKMLYTETLGDNNNVGMGMGIGMVAWSGTNSGPLSVRHHRSPVIIVALTASSLQSDRNSALAAGCNDFLTKPVSLVWLEKKIIEWGCMQALIDFEGWKRWKASEPNNNSNSIMKSNSTNSNTSLISASNSLSEKLNSDRSKGAMALATPMSHISAVLSASGQENANAIAARLRIEKPQRKLQGEGDQGINLGNEIGSGSGSG